MTETCPDGMNLVHEISSFVTIAWHRFGSMLHLFVSCQPAQCVYVEMVHQY